MYVSWHHVPTGGILLRHSPDHGEHWSGAFLVSEVGAFPSVNAWADTVHVVWPAPDRMTAASEVFVRSSPDAGGNWTPVRMVSSPDGVSSWVPSVASWGPNVHVVWSDERHNNDDCRFGRVPCREEEYYRRSEDFGASWDPEVRLTHDPPASPQPSWAPSVAVVGPTVHVTFFDARTGRFEIYYKRSRGNGEPESWENEILLSTDPVPQVQRARPVIAALRTDVHIVYFGAGPHLPSAVYFLSSPDGGDHFHAPIGLAPGGLHPSVAISPRGTTHVVWYGGDARGINQIFHRRAR